MITNTKCTRSSGTRLSALETYGRVLSLIEVIAIFENWRNQSPTRHGELFRIIIDSLTAHFDLDSKLVCLLPRESSFKNSLSSRSRSETHCFRDTHARLLAGREALLPWLLMATYSEHPPTMVETYRFLKLGDIQELLEKIALTLKIDAQYVTGKSGYYLSRYMEDHDQQLNFLMQTLQEYGFEAETYAEAVKEYVTLLDSIFPATTRNAAPSGDLSALVSTVPETVGL